ASAGGRVRAAGHAHCNPSSASTNLAGAAMYYDDDSGAVYFIAGILLGTVMGVSLALLTAPQTGKRTRKRLVRAVSTARDAAGDRWEDLADQVQRGRQRIRL
ncbi:MAG: YtxH domain-containing protein, partial [Longimicrobiales bacterium]